MAALADSTPDADADSTISQAASRPVGLRWWHEATLAIALYLCYDAARGLRHGSVARADRDGWDILDLERFLHLDPEGWLNSHLASVSLLAVAACYLYATLHFVVTPWVLIWTYRSRPAFYPQARTTLAIVTAGALVGFWLFPTAPPRLLVGANFHDTLAVYSSWGWWGSQTSVPQATASLANQFAAMPSLHVAWAVWCSATLLRYARTRWVKVLAAGYPAVIAVVVLATANHYVLDVVAGAALWALSHALVGVYSSRSATADAVTWT